MSGSNSMSSPDSNPVKKGSNLTFYQPGPILNQICFILLSTLFLLGFFSDWIHPEGRTTLLTTPQLVKNLAGSPQWDFLAVKKLPPEEKPFLGLPLTGFLVGVVLFTTALLFFGENYRFTIPPLLFLTALNGHPPTALLLLVFSLGLLALFYQAKESLITPLKIIEFLCWIFILPYIFFLNPGIFVFALFLGFMGFVSSRGLFPYFIRRSLQSLPVLFGVSTITFGMMFVVPGDPARLMFGNSANPEAVARERTRLGLDLPVYHQYVGFLARLLRGDLGTSFYKSEKAVTEIIIETLPATILLAYFSLVLAVFWGVFAGIVSAVKRYSLMDNVVMILALVGVSMPVFWFGYILQKYIAMQFEFFPVQGYEDGLSRFLILPSITLSTIPMAMIARLTRSSMLEVINQDYIRTARAKGLVENIVIFKHALKNALIPVVTYIGGSIGSLMSGAVLTETIFSWPGIGRLSLERILARDFPVIQGTVLFAALMFVFCNILVDIAYALIDPRVKYD